MQRRIAAGVREMLELWFQHKPFSEDFYIVREGKLAEQYTVHEVVLRGNSLGGSCKHIYSHMAYVWQVNFN